MCPGPYPPHPRGGKQGARGAGRAVPLAFLIAAVGVLLVAYTFVRLCQYYRQRGRGFTSLPAARGAV